MIIRQSRSFASFQFLLLNCCCRSHFALIWISLTSSRPSTGFRALLNNVHSNFKSSPSFGMSSTIWFANDAAKGISINDMIEEDETGNLHIPSGGISVSDEMEAKKTDSFVTILSPIDSPSFPMGSVAQIATSSVNTGSLELIRYLVALSPPHPNGYDAIDNDANGSDMSTEERAVASAGAITVAAIEYCLVDIPPFSMSLVSQLQDFLSMHRGRLRLMVVTSRDAIHYPDMISSYFNKNGNEDTMMSMIRKADLHSWKKAFPDVAIITYRLDTPRDCREVATQILDGYGPFALHENWSSLDFTIIPTQSVNSTSKIFQEMGRPLTVDEWDFNTAQNVMKGKQTPPDDIDLNQEIIEISASNCYDSVDKYMKQETAQYTPLAIRHREQGKPLIAVFTPGHTFGSVSYIFPDTGVCCSGLTIPVEDSRMSGDDEICGSDSSDKATGSGGGMTTGPILDCRGYVTTSGAGISRQMESARHLIKTYSDRFHVVLPSRGDPWFLNPESIHDRQQTLLKVVEQYERIGTIYEQLGIMPSTE